MAYKNKIKKVSSETRKFLKDEDKYSDKVAKKFKSKTRVTKKLK